MARYDKYDPISGGSRAKLDAPLPLTNGSIGPVAVSLNTSGRVIVGTGGQSGLFGVLVKNVARGPLGAAFTSTFDGVPNPYAPIGGQAGDVVDVMQHGDIVDLDKAAFPAGSKVFAAANGTLSTTSAAGSFPIGWTVEAGRLVVRVAPGIPAATV